MSRKPSQAEETLAFFKRYIAEFRVKDAFLLCHRQIMQGDRTSYYLDFWFDYIKNASDLALIQADVDYVMSPYRSLNLNELLFKAVLYDAWFFKVIEEEESQRVGIGLLTDASNKGDLGARLILGTRLKHGEGCDQDINRAINLYQETNLPQAKTLLLLLYVQYVGFYGRHPIVFSLLGSAAEYQETNALCYLADMTDAEDVETIGRCYQTAYSLGNIEWGLIGYVDFLCTQDRIEEAFQLLTRAEKEFNDPYITIQLAYMYMRGVGATKNTPLATSMLTSLIEGKYSKSLKISALVQLAMSKSDEQQELLERAAELGCVSAHRRLADLHYVQQRSELAIFHYEKAIRLNDARAMIERAQMHMQGIGGPTDTTTAYYLYNRAAIRGWDAASQFFHHDESPFDAEKLLSRIWESLSKEFPYALRKVIDVIHPALLSKISPEFIFNSFIVYFVFNHEDITILQRAADEADSLSKLFSVEHKKKLTSVCGELEKERKVALLYGLTKSLRPIAGSPLFEKRAINIVFSFFGPSRKTTNNEEKPDQINELFPGQA